MGTDKTTPNFLKIGVYKMVCPNCEKKCIAEIRNDAHGLYGHCLESGVDFDCTRGYEDFISEHNNLTPVDLKLLMMKQLSLPHKTSIAEFDVKEVLKIANALMENSITTQTTRFNVDYLQCEYCDSAAQLGSTNPDNLIHKKVCPTFPAQEIIDRFKGIVK